MLWLLLHRDPLASDQEREQAVSAHEPRDLAERNAQGTDFGHAGCVIHDHAPHRQIGPDCADR